MMAKDIYMPSGLNELKWKYTFTVSFLHNNSVTFMENKSYQIITLTS